MKDLRAAAGKTQTQEVQVKNIMANYYEMTEELTLPVIPVRGNVAFPSVQINIDVLRAFTLKALGEATSSDAKVLLLTQKDLSSEMPTESRLYRTGTVCVVKQVVKNPSGNLSVVFEGIGRASVVSITEKDGVLIASVIMKHERVLGITGEKSRALMNEIMLRLDELRKISPTFSDEMYSSAMEITEAGHFADFVASSALMEYKNKQAVLEAVSPVSRLEKLLFALEEELEIVKCEYEINSKVHAKIDRNQKEYFLREQIRAIQEELGDDSDDEIAEYSDKIAEAKLPMEVEEKLLKELGRLAKTPFGSAEGSVIRTYLDTCLDFPWTKRTNESPNVEYAAKVLNECHDGLEKVKDRILEFVAVKQISPGVKNQIICLIGPPGVGKTSVAASVAKALRRKYARVSLGGMRDEAEIRGHRKTYIGAMPGRIIDAITTAGVINPVIVLDEIDKMSSDGRGDPSAALLEVLDPEQNKSFHDNFMEIPIDLSECMFIATANSYEGIPYPLLDRMEVIELSAYSDSEKLAIAKNHLVPNQLKKHGMNRRRFKITDGALLAVINSYTKEAGVRNLERVIASLIRKTARKIAAEEAKSVTITEKNLRDFLGKEKFLPETPENEDPVGVVNGLAYTQYGGDLLKVEVVTMEGTGKIELTGSLGDVMKESAKIAHSYVRSVAQKYGIDPGFYKNKDLHIHFPEGAVPKDGPSAGVTMVTAIISALSERKVRHDVAMTGEVTLRGKVLAIGGLKEKTLAAYRAGVLNVIIPRENARDIDELDPECRKNLNFITVSDVSEVIENALLPR